MTRTSTKKNGRYKRAMFTLPEPLLAKVQKYAGALRQGNKSGFVADAIESYIDHLRKVRHTARMRASYAASAKDSLAVAREWEVLDEDMLERLEKLEAENAK